MQNSSTPSHQHPPPPQKKRKKKKKAKPQLQPGPHLLLSIPISDLLCGTEGAADCMKTNAVFRVIKALCSQHQDKLIPPLPPSSSPTPPPLPPPFVSCTHGPFSFIPGIFQGYQTAHMHNWNQVSLVGILHRAESECLEMTCVSLFPLFTTSTLSFDLSF